MQPETSKLIAAIDEQTTLFRELEHVLQASRSAYAARNLDLIYIHLAKQTALCQELRKLQAETERAAQAAFPSTNPSLLDGPAGFSPALRKAFLELAGAQQGVRRMNAEQQAFLAGSLRTLRVMNNALWNSYAIYTQANSPWLAVREGARS